MSLTDPANCRNWARNPPSPILPRTGRQVEAWHTLDRGFEGGQVSTRLHCSDTAQIIQQHTLVHPSTDLIQKTMTTTMMSKTVNMQRSAQTVLRPSTVSSFARPLAARPSYSSAVVRAEHGKHENLDSDSYQVCDLHQSALQSSRCTPCMHAKLQTMCWKLVI